MKRAARLTWRFALLPALAVVALTCVMLAFGHHLLGTQLIDHGLTRNQQRADVMGLQLQLALQDSVNQVRLLARSPLLHPGAPMARVRTELDHVIAQSPKFVWIGLVALDGQVLAGSRGWLEGQSIGARPVFKLGLQGMVGDVHKAVALAPLLAQLPGGLDELIDIGEPVLDDEGGVIAVVTAHLGLNWVRNQVELSLGNPFTAQQLGLQALVLREPDGLSVIPRATVPQHLPTDLAQAQGWTAGDGQRYLVAQTHLRGEAGESPLLPWRVLVLQREAATLAPLSQLTSSMLQVGIVSALLLAGIGVWLSRRMLTPWNPVFEAVLEDEALEAGTPYSAQVASRVLGLVAQHAQPTATEKLMGWLARDAGNLRRAFDHLPAAIGLLDRDYRIEYLNPAFSRLLGWTAERARGQIAGECLVDPAEREGFLRLYQQLGDPPGEFVARLEALTPLGERVAVQFHLVPMFDGGGARVGALCIVHDIRAERRARATAYAMTGRLRALADAALDTLLATLDIDGRVLEWSRGAEQISGCPPALAIGRPLEAVLPCEQRAEAWLRQARIDGHCPLALPMSVANGSTRWFVGSVYALGLAPGSARFGVILRDETARREAFLALEQSEARLRLAIAGGQLGAWEISLAGEAHEAVWAESYGPLLGLPEEAARPSASRLSDLVHPDDWPRVKAAMDRAADDEQPLRVEFRIRHPDGWRHHALYGQARRGADGRPDSLVGVGLDVTEQHLARQAVAGSEARLSAIVGNASDAIISVNGEGLITLFNPAAERIFGHAAAQMLGAPMERLLPEAARPSHRAMLDGFAHSGVSQRAMGAGRVQGRRADGRLLELEASISQAVANDQTVLTAILRDVTGRVAQEQLLEQTRDELAQLNRRLLEQEKQTSRKLAQSLHDELGQTLAALRLHWEAYRGAAAAQREKMDERIANLVVLANRQIRSVLSELRPPLLDELGLAAALDNEIRQHNAAEGEVQVTLDASAEAQLQRWLPDIEYAVFMVAREALINALRHASARHVGMHLAGDAGWLELRIEDDGIGMAPGARVGRPGHLGLIGMRERALAIGAQLRIDGSPGHGTLVALTWEQGPGDEPHLPD
jgi:PAS domain S-box-containing protein